MKKTEKKELKNLSAKEIEQKIDAIRRELFSSRLHSTTRPVKDKKMFKKMKKDIARGLTFLAQKNAE